MRIPDCAANNIRYFRCLEPPDTTFDSANRLPRLPHAATYSSTYSLDKMASRSGSKPHVVCIGNAHIGLTIPQTRYTRVVWVDTRYVPILYDLYAELGILVAFWSSLPVQVG
jgi:hypothetical protein